MILMKDLISKTKEKAMEYTDETMVQDMKVNGLIVKGKELEFSFERLGINIMESFETANNKDTDL